MNNTYRLARKTNKGLQIGLNTYTKEQAEQRKAELEKVGIKMIVMLEDILLG